jgi:hypothetical protein
MMSSALNVRGIDAFLTHELTQFPEVSENSRFHQDGATSHSATNSVNALNRSGTNHVLSRNGDVSGQHCRQICRLVTFRFEASDATEIALVTR